MTRPCTLRTGLVSVTFRQLTPEQIVHLASDAGLDAIEWGGDVHCPPGDLAAARRARDLTSSAGLLASAYGSYYRAAEADSPPIAAVIASATELGTSIVRVWAGPTGSAAATADSRARVVEDLQRISDAAATSGLSISLEYHRDTLTDTPESTIELIRAVARPNLFTYWQPRHGLSLEENLADLATLRPWLRDAHVFHWWPDARTRLPLREGCDRWRTYLADVASDDGPHVCALEFVAGDSVDQFVDDARTLTELVRNVQSQ